ncbi:MAG: M4 family metallopeptidase [Saprospiraceae bacterium]
MKKIISLLMLLAFAAAPIFAQHGKTKPSTTAPPSSSEPKPNWPGKAMVPPATNPFGVATQRPKPMPPLQTSAGLKPSEVSVVRGENGLPIFFEGKTAASGTATESQSFDERAVNYCASLNPQGIAQPETEFVAKTTETDEQGNAHVRLEQMFNGLSVWGGEVICHTKNGSFDRMNGRYFPTPKLASIVPSVSADAAILKVKTEIGVSNIKTDWTAEDLKLIDGQPFSANLIVFHPKENLSGERLTWHVAARPNIFSRSEWFIDAITGEVLNQFEHTCNLLGHYHGLISQDANNSECTIRASPNYPIAPDFAMATAGKKSILMDGPINISGTDLLGITRNFTLGGWQFGNQFALEDASKPMFKPNSSNMPGDPVGVIVTLDAFNTSPENQNFNADIVVSNSATFSNKQAAISSHYNAIKSFDYFRSKFTRNSIDGVGGNVISIANVTEANGTSMENAFWNGQAMFYGNGGSTFKPLARGLDVGGHEMTHGVVEKTANLVYQGESGALNESFADIFGQMIDGDANDWKIGEDVMQSGGGLPTALRDLSNPHNGQPTNSGFWQPNHTNEQYMGSQDNGGVHINSGITNRAFFLFASNASVGTAKAEQVYYKALKDYLVKSSKFIDCRIAVIQAATDLYGAAVANVAADAFAQVGIGSGAPSGNYLGQLSPNPGTDYILCTSNNGNNLDLANGTGQIITSLYTEGVYSRPSITDNGVSLVFVNDAKELMAIEFDYALNQFVVFQVFPGPYRNAAISKDGRFVAVLDEFAAPRIKIYDFADPDVSFETFFLYNPTYTQGQITGDVEYADVMEFDYSGQYLMYDAHNDLDGVGYWDIGFLQYWENDQFTDGGDAFITKLFTGLPEKVSINNPTIAKNSPFVIAFDLIDEVSTLRYDIMGANSETGDYDVIVSNNGELGWPNYTRLDNKLMYEKPNATGYDLRLQSLNPNKIQPQGNSSQIVSAHYWGVWFANGVRDLQVGTDELEGQNFDLKISPNPTADFAQLSLRANTASDAIISLHNLLGETLMTRSINLSEGENLLDIDLQHLPSGNYVVRIATENGGGAALKVVKQ